MFKRILFLTLILFFTELAQAQVELRRISMDEYIEKYSELAIKEMERTGIPASIKMAQAILESGFGNSDLATRARNHFGIKCHVGWTGPSVRMDDDEENECFRKYRRVEESFLDHSEFLTTRPRYAFLFDLDVTDYRNWARGLQRAGYATNPNYANLLIRLIEEKDLNLLDSKGRSQLLAKQKESGKSPTIEDYAGRVMSFNNIQTVVVQPDETLFDIAMQHGVRLPRLMRYNDIDEEDDYVLSAGEKIYLQPKRRRGNERFHIVKEGQTMHEISQRQGIRLNRLYRRNRMDVDEEAKPGERLVLRGRRHEKPAVLSEEDAIALRESRQQEQTGKKIEPKKKMEVPVKRAEPREEIFVSITEPDMSTSRERITVAGQKSTIEETMKETPEVKREEKPALEDITLNNNEVRIDNPVAEDREEKITSPKVERKVDFEPAADVPTYHVVQRGETLYAISVRYNVAVYIIQEINNLKSTDLSPGQRLRLRKQDSSPTAATSSATEKQTERRKKTHRVESGQTFFAISRLYNVSVDDLRKWNNTDGSSLSVGQEIIVGYEVIEKTASQPERTTPDSNQTRVHYVEGGQTLFSIARLYNVSVAQLREWNELRSDNLNVGQKLVVGK